MENNILTEGTPYATPQFVYKGYAAAVEQTTSVLLTATFPLGTPALADFTPYSRSGKTDHYLVKAEIRGGSHDTSDWALLISPYSYKPHSIGKKGNLVLGGSKTHFLTWYGAAEAFERWVLNNGGTLV